MTHSRTKPEIDALVEKMEPKISEITDFTYNHRARLVKPMLSYDGAAIALSFLPAAGEGQLANSEIKADAYTYHHLRRDLYELCQSTGIDVASRYVVPSSHLTIARFVTQDVHKEGKVGQLVEELEMINQKLKNFWPGEKSIDGMMQWVVGEEKGLECRKGTVWYGGGERDHLGQGFSD